MAALLEVRPVRRAHLIVGTLALLGFVLSGQYMHRVHAHLVGMPDAPRLLYRSAHIYWLFAALLNLLLWAHWTPARAGWPRQLQRLASVALLLVPGFFVAAFATEPHLSGLVRPWARPGIYLSLAATLAHLMARWGTVMESRRTADTEGGSGRVAARRCPAADRRWAECVDRNASYQVSSRQDADFHGTFP